MHLVCVANLSIMIGWSEATIARHGQGVMAFQTERSLAARIG